MSCELKLMDSTHPRNFNTGEDPLQDKEIGWETPFDRP